METANIETNPWFKILKVILYLLLLTPLWFLSIFLFPFITTKVLYLRVLVEIALVIYVALALKYPVIRPKWNWLLISVWVYMLVISVTSVFGVNISKSFLGTIERGEGILTMIHYALYFTMLTSVFRTGKDWYRYLMSSVGVIGFIGIYGLLQLTGASVVISGQGSRISGTIGNPAFFAAVMLFGIFLSIYLLYHPRTKKSKDKKIYLYIVLAVTLIATYSSQTRGALVALISSALIYTLFLVVKSKKTRTRVVAGFLLLFMVLGGVGLYFGRDSQFVKSQNTLERLATISPTDITTQSRFDTWNASWEGWKDRFLFGYGYENYNIAFNKYFPARIYKDQGSQIWFDRAHNIIFDIGTTSGIVGLVSYLSIFFVAIWGLFKLYRKAQGQNISSVIGWQPPVVLALGLGAYFIQNFFVFDTHATYLYLFITLAYVSYLLNVNFTEEKTVAEDQKEGSKFNLVVVPGVTLVVLFSIYFLNLEPALANLNTINGILAARTGNYQNVHSSFEKSLSYGTYMDEEIRQRLVDFANETVASGQLSSQEQSEMIQFTIDELKKSIKDSSEDAKNYLFLMTLYNRVGAQNPGFADLSLELGKTALDLSPTRPQIFFETGQAYFNKGVPEKGVEQFELALKLNEEPKESHFNLIVASILAEREDLIEREFNYIEESPDYNFTSSDFLTLSRAYRQVGNLKKFVEMQEMAFELGPESPEGLARLAAAYGEVCDVESAKNATDKAVDLNSSFAVDANNFIKQLTERCSQ